MARSWFEQDAFWNAVGPSLAGSDPAGRAEEVAAAVLGYAGLTDDEAVADLACGSGHLALALARRGHRVTAVDTHAPYVTALGRDAEAEGLPVEVVRRDVRRFERVESFGLVVLWGDSLGCFDGMGDDQALLGGAWRSLREGGTLAVQITPKELAAARWPERTWSILGDRIVLEEHRIGRSFTQVRHGWTVVEPAGARQAFVGTRRLYAASELVRMLEEVGFESVECLGAMDRRSFGRHAETLIAVARR